MSFVPKILSFHPQMKYQIYQICLCLDFRKDMICTRLVVNCSHNLSFRLSRYCIFFVVQNNLQMGLIYLKHPKHIKIIPFKTEDGLFMLRKIEVRGLIAQARTFFLHFKRNRLYMIKNMYAFENVIFSNEEAQGILEIHFSNCFFTAIVVHIIWVENQEDAVMDLFISTCSVLCYFSKKEISKDVSIALD
ncbi:hypothetical protein ACJX0J_035343 [Zea mays]